MKDPNPYLATQVVTAPPEKLIVMLHDALIRHAQHASEQLREGNLEAAHDALVRSQAITSELIASLNFDADADLCQKLLQLYHYIYHNLAEANFHHRPESIDDALAVIRLQRETWAEAIGRLAEDAGQTEAPDRPSDPEPVTGPHSSSKSDCDLNSAYSSGNVWNV